MIDKIYIIERVTERDSVIAKLAFSISECRQFMRSNRNLMSDTIWCWSVTIISEQKAVTDPRIFFDWDGRVLFRKDENIHVRYIFDEKEFQPLKARLRARR